VKNPKGYAKTEMKLIWVEYFIWGVRKGDTSLIWRYPEGYNFDLGVREYQKIENPCFTGLKKKLTGVGFIGWLGLDSIVLI